MALVNQFINNTIKHYDAVKRCTSVLSPLGVTYFYYSSVKSNGEHTLLTDCPGAEEFYYLEKIFCNDPHLKHPDNYKPGFFLFEYNRQSQFNTLLSYLDRNFGIHPLIGLCEKRAEEVEFFCFWGNPNNARQFENVYLNYGNLLKSFAPHFKESCAPILQSETAPILSLNEILGEELFLGRTNERPKIDAQALRKYLIAIGFAKEVAKADALSRQEKACLKELIQWKSAKETAATLKLSSRTIEHYLDNIKNKFDCQYKRDLFVIAEKLHSLGLI